MIDGSAVSSGDRQQESPSDTNSITQRMLTQSNDTSFHYLSNPLYNSENSPSGAKVGKRKSEKMPGNRLVLSNKQPATILSH